MARSKFESQRPMGLDGAIGTPTHTIHKGESPRWVTLQSRFADLTRPLIKRIRARKAELVKELSLQAKGRATFCIVCGTEIPYDGSPFVLWGKVRRCHNCGGKVAKAVRHCRRCGKPVTYEEFLSTAQSGNPEWGWRTWATCTGCKTKETGSSVSARELREACRNDPEIIELLARIRAIRQDIQEHGDPWKEG